MSTLIGPGVDTSARPAYPVSFSREDLALFTRASGDQNPLHVSDLYARPTPYGELLVYGYLGVLACYSRIHLPEGWALMSFAAEFLRPMVMGVPYQVEAPAFEPEGTGGKWTVALFDGTVPMITLSVHAGPCTPAGSIEPAPTAACFRTEGAVSRPLDSIVPGLETFGRYASDPAGLRELCERWGVDAGVAWLFCFSSYIVGTELPGESNLCGKVEVRLHRPVSTPMAVEFHAKVGAIDKRFNKIRVDVNLSAAGSPVATGQYWSFVRPALEPEPPACSDGVRTDALRGRSAVIVGASRGLGAALRSAMTLRGAAVYSISRSEPNGEDAFTLRGDATDTDSLDHLRARVVSGQARLSFLICNAFPPVFSLRLESNAASRIAAYINEAVSMTLLPMCALLDLLHEGGGCLVLISSTAVEQPGKDSPQYAAAKAAVEMLARVAALQYPGIRTLIVRPGKLLTALTNTPVGRLGAASPRDFAAKLATRLETALDIDAGAAEIFL